MNLKTVIKEHQKLLSHVILALVLVFLLLVLLVQPDAFGELYKAMILSDQSPCIEFNCNPLSLL